jgi:hypothetical protein
MPEYFKKTIISIKPWDKGQSFNPFVGCFVRALLCYFLKFLKSITTKLICGILITPKISKLTYYLFASSMLLLSAFRYA